MKEGRKEVIKRKERKEVMNKEGRARKRGRDLGKVFIATTSSRIHPSGSPINGVQWI